MADGENEIKIWRNGRMLPMRERVWASDLRHAIWVHQSVQEQCRTGPTSPPDASRVPWPGADDEATADTAP
jgi:hypothetical protein